MLAFAESTPVLKEMAEISFAPIRAVGVVVDEAGRVHFLPAVIHESGDQVEGGTLNSYLIGVDLSKINENIKLVSVTVTGDGTAEAVTPIRRVGPNDILQISPENLRNEIKTKRADLASLETTLNKEVLNLKRLRADAGRIVNLGKIIELEDETKKIKESADAIERDIAALKVSIEAIKDIKEPRRFDNRKVVLTEQLSELAKASLAAEQAMPALKKTSEMELDRKFALIQSTRFDDLEELEKEYEVLTGQPFPQNADEWNDQEAQGADYLSLDEG
jgi:hypothetical protein